jgi:hypothetical protein
VAVTDGLVAYYPLNGDAKDLSGHDYHGTVHGAVPAKDRHGNDDHAYRMEGLNHISLDHRTFDGMADFTTSAWISLDHLNRTGNLPCNTIMSVANAREDNLFLWHSGLVWDDGRSSDDNIRVAMLRGWRSYPGSVLATGTWHHVAITREFNRMTLYVQGQLIATRHAPETVLIADEGGVILGQDQDSLAGSFQACQSLSGRIDDVCIYHRALSPDEIRELYESQESRKETARSFAETAVVQVLNPKTFSGFLHETAIRKNGQPGSALHMISQQPSGSPDLTISETIYFRNSEIPRVSSRFPDDMWDENRIPSHIRNGLGCLVVLEIKDESTKGLVAFVVEEVDGEYRIIYIDDN